MGRRSVRASARRAAAALAEGTPKSFQQAIDDDEPMLDAKPDTPEPEPAAAEEEAPEEVEEDEAAAESGGGEDEAPEVVESEREPTPPPEPVVVRRKRLGRPPKIRPPDWDQGLPSTPGGDNSDATPRRRGRGGWRGRGGRKGQQAPLKLQQPIDKEGTVADIADDECVLPEDPEGEAKVDKLGNLQGGRDYRCRTFTVKGRGDRLYMLSTEPARCVGFRDSYLFFTKHLRLYKIIVSDEEKLDMIEREIIPHSYKGRSIGLVTARSVFREFGARMIVGGRRIIDDYDVAQARAEGVAEGEIADPMDEIIPGQPYDKNRYVAWHGASAVYHQSAPAIQVPTGKPEIKKRRVNVNDTNWMHEHAKDASEFNRILTPYRLELSKGVYDIHTNQMHYPAIFQPTHARIVQMAPGAEPEPSDDDDDISPVSPSNNNNNNNNNNDSNGSKKQQLGAVPAVVARNFTVVDTYMEAPPGGVSALAYEAHPAADFLAPFQGLSAVPDDIKDLLPADCRAALDGALARERDWKARWRGEATDTCRRLPIIDKSIVPQQLP